MQVQTLHGVFFSADNAANLIGVEVYDNGAAASLSGSVIGYAIRADGGTLTITGTLSGNKASIVLPASAYVIEGSLDIVIKVVSGSVKTTVGACRGYVTRATTDTIIDPGHVIPSLEELLAQINACETATNAANTAASNANSKATAANTAAGNANTATSNANTATNRANAAASALENMDATASGLAAGASPTATVSTVNNHYRIAFGIPKGDKGDTGNTGAAATITSTAVAYQNSQSGTTIPTGTWQTTQPETPQGQYLWVRTILTWNNGQTTTLYSVSRQGIDGSGSVVSVNNVSPDANGNVTLPVDAVPTSGSSNPVSSDGVYDALSGKQGTLTFDSTPTSGSSNPVTSGGVDAALTNAERTIAIVATGNTAPQDITIGRFVIWQGALYAAKTNIASGTTLSTSNLRAIPDGGLNALNDDLYLDYRGNSYALTSSHTINWAILTTVWKQVVLTAVITFKSDVAAGTTFATLTTTTYAPPINTMTYGVDSSGNVIPVFITSDGNLQLIKETIQSGNYIYINATYNRKY